LSVRFDSLSHLHTKKVFLEGGVIVLLGSSDASKVQGTRARSKGREQGPRDASKLVYQRAVGMSLFIHLWYLHHSWDELSK